MNKPIDRFKAIISAASVRDHTQFLAAVAVHHTMFVDLFSLLKPVDRSERAHAKAEALQYGYYFAAAQMAREMKILPGSYRDIVRLIQFRYWDPLGKASWTSNAAIAFVKAAGDLLREVVMHDTVAWNLARNREDLRCHPKELDGVTEERVQHIVMNVLQNHIEVKQGI